MVGGYSSSFFNGLKLLFFVKEVGEKQTVFCAHVPPISRPTQNLYQERVPMEACERELSNDFTFLCLELL